MALPTLWHNLGTGASAITYTDHAKSMLAAAVREGRINELRAEWPQASIQALSAASGVSMREITRRIDNPFLSPYTMLDEAKRWPTPHADRFISALANRWPPHPVVALYWDVLDREPDQEGFDYWCKRLEAVGLAQVRREFVANISDEDRARLEGLHRPT